MELLQNMIDCKVATMKTQKKSAGGFFPSPLHGHSILLSRIRKTAFFFAMMVLLCAFAAPALASGVDDPVAMIDKLKEYIFNALAAIGLILIGLGVVQIGLSFKSQDPSQRSIGMLCTFGGIIVAGVKFVVETIGGA